MHRILILGRGLIGSAAGRHLAGLTDGVVILGPDEPRDRSAHTGVFASHYDEGRMTRITDPDPIWALTAKRSIERYPEIEAQSGIAFFTNSEYLGIGTRGSESLQRAAQIGLDLGADVSRLDADGIRDRYPFLAVADAAQGLHEGERAGHLSPRAMVSAQTEAARRRGAEIVSAEAVAVHAVAGGVEVETDCGQTLRAEKLLVAAGAFTDACGLSPVNLQLRVFGRTVVLARIDDELQSHLAGMPTIGDAESGAYILPPIRYPNGRSYLKIGVGSTSDPELRTLADLQAWFKSAGSAANRHDFERFITGLIPALRDCAAWHTDTCAVTWTATHYPTIDHVLDERIAVAVGGNGKGAKSADEWGLVAARLVAGLDWDDTLPREPLRLHSPR